MASMKIKHKFEPGTEIGLWTVLGHDRNPNGQLCYLCECRCGKQSLVRPSVLAKQVKGMGCTSCMAKQRPKVEVICCDCGDEFEGTAKSIRCKRCKKKLEARLSAEWRKEHPEEARKISSGYYHRHKHKPEAIARLRAKNLAIYGITIEYYEAMLQAQGGTCAICNEKEPGLTPSGKAKLLAVDHDHETGRVRGLLCSRCNQALGGMRESKVLIRRMLKYLKTHGK